MSKTAGTVAKNAALIHKLKQIDRGEEDYMIIKENDEINKDSVKREMDIPFVYIDKQLKNVITLNMDKTINMVDTSIKHLTNPQGKQEPIIELVRDHDPEKKIARRIKFLFKSE